MCVSQALIENGEKSAYFHQLALCCRLRGDFEDALCHIKLGLEKFDKVINIYCKEINFMTSINIFHIY